MKTFKNDFNKLLNKCKNKENFAFTRASDGELFILENKELELSECGTFLDGELVYGAYPKSDWKHFKPKEHKFLYDKLHESLRYKHPNYYVGLSCMCCVGLSKFKLMKQMRGCDDEQTTWANLFVNSNYPQFVKEFIPELQKRGIILICNKEANLENSGIPIIKDFRIGENAMINNFNLHEDISKWIEDNNIQNHVFCFSASSLTNVTVYELFKKYPQNTYLDIGTTLNKILDLPISRDYLKAYYNNEPHPDLKKVCIWI